VSQYYYILRDLLRGATNDYLYLFLRAPHNHKAEGRLTLKDTSPAYIDKITELKSGDVFKKRVLNILPGSEVTQTL
jgi:hypothetical protein